MTLEELIVHRELQCLRAEAACAPRRPMSERALRRRRAYASLRRKKLDAATRLAQSRRVDGIQ